MAIQGARGNHAKFGQCVADIEDAERLRINAERGAPAGESVYSFIPASSPPNLAAVH